jgi:hypothetical protein
MVTLFLLAITFHPVSVKDLPTTRWTHVHVCGLVTFVKGEADGDTHVRITDGARFVVGEIIPALRQPAPKRGQRICVDGISREDKAHGWFEVHPILRWQLQRPAR